MVTRSVGDRDDVERWLTARDDLVVERSCGANCFEAAEGPVRSYRRTVEVDTGPDGTATITSTTDFELAIPFVAWLMTWPTKRELRRPPGSRHDQPWWAPPERLDPRASSAIGLLVVLSLVTGYLGTLISQTLTYAADEFDVDNRAQGATLAAVRVGVLLALVLVALADRRGRRKILLVSAVGGCASAALGAVAPSMFWLAASQTLSRAFASAMVILVTVVAAEEMPRGSRAYAVSVLGLTGALGAGLCVMSLPVAGLAEPAWRLLYLTPLLALPVVRSVSKQLTESRRFGLGHAHTTMSGHRGRLALLAATATLLALFTAPASQFLNEFLRVERGFSASKIALFTVITNTPGGIGVVVGGRLADVRGRRIVGAIGVAGGVGATVMMYLSEGWPLWAWSLIGAVVAGAVIPALGVYGPELFPTSLRGRANGILAICGVVGAGLGLLAAGELSERFGGLGQAMAILSLGSVVVVVLLLTLFPETAHHSLEDLNPEDDPVPPIPPTAGAGGFL